AAAREPEGQEKGRSETARTDSCEEREPLLLARRRFAGRTADGFRRFRDQQARGRQRETGRRRRRRRKVTFRGRSGLTEQTGAHMPRRPRQTFPALLGTLILIGCGWKTPLAPSAASAATLLNPSSIAGP